MKAFGVTKIHTAGFIEAPKPICGPQDAICRPIAVAPCTTDVHNLLDDKYPFPQGSILGHECVGEVVEVGNLIKDFKVGDKVVVPSVTPDWGSRASQEGFHQHSNRMLGGFKFSGEIGGSFAEFFRVKEADANLALLPEGMSPATACMAVDMMTTGFPWCRTCRNPIW